MPIYEYTCKACDATFEQLQRSMTQPEPAKCPKCGSKKTARNLSVFAVGADSPRRQTGVTTPSTGMCGRCGGPGPCAMGD